MYLNKKESKKKTKKKAKKTEKKNIRKKKAKKKEFFKKHYLFINQYPHTPSSSISNVLLKYFLKFAISKKIMFFERKKKDAKD
jgi:hypothetical protein